MPVHWTISHASRLVVAVAKDQMTASDIEKYFAAITADGAMAYRKIFEITHTPMVLSEDNLRALGERVVLYAQHGQIGPGQPIGIGQPRHQAILFARFEMIPAVTPQMRCCCHMISM